MVVMKLFDRNGPNGWYSQAWISRADQSGGIVSRVLEICQTLIVQLLAGHYRDRLRDFHEAVTAPEEIAIDKQHARGKKTAREV